MSEFEHTDIRYTCVSLGWELGKVAERKKLKRHFRKHKQMKVECDYWQKRCGLAGAHRVWPHVPPYQC